jgi:hypothetical protein
MKTPGQELEERIAKLRIELAATFDPHESDKIQAEIDELDDQMDQLIDTSWDRGSRRLA